MLGQAGDKGRAGVENEAWLLWVAGMFDGSGGKLGQAGVEGIDIGLGEIEGRGVGVGQLFMSP